MQVHSLDDLLKINCIHGITPTLSTPSGLWYKFTNVCLGFEDTSIKSNPGYYCSPIHGWTKKDTKRSKKNGTLFEGKVPLSSQFMASHADLLKSATEVVNNTAESTKLPLIKLTVNMGLT